MPSHRRPRAACESTVRAGFLPSAGDGEVPKVAALDGRRDPGLELRECARVLVDGARDSTRREVDLVLAGPRPGWAIEDRKADRVGIDQDARHARNAPRASAGVGGPLDAVRGRVERGQLVGRQPTRIGLARDQGDGGVAGLLPRREIGRQAVDPRAGRSHGRDG